MERYSLSARILHWLMAIGFLFMWACGYAMTTLVGEDIQLEEALFGLHISVGVSLIALLVLRIVIRLTSETPAPLAALAGWEKLASHLGHLALYALPVLIIALGWAETDFGGHGVKWFGVALPKLLPTMEVLWGVNLEAATSQLHKYLAYGMLAVAAVHVGAVVKHRIQGHDVLNRMTFR